MSHEATACNVTSDIIEVSALLRTILDFCNTLSNKIRRLIFAWYSYSIFPAIWKDPSINLFSVEIVDKQEMLQELLFYLNPQRYSRRYSRRSLKCCLGKLNLATTPWLVTFEDPYKLYFLMIAFPFTINMAWHKKRCLIYYFNEMPC